MTFKQEWDTLAGQALVDYAPFVEAQGAMTSDMRRFLSEVLETIIVLCAAVEEARVSGVERGRMFAGEATNGAIPVVPEYKFDTFDDGATEESTRVLLAMTELAEAATALIQGGGDIRRPIDDYLPHRPEYEVELADCVIRLLHTGALNGLDVGGAVEEKMAYNRTRPKLHGGKKI